MMKNIVKKIKKLKPRLYYWVAADSNGKVFKYHQKPQPSSTMWVLGGHCEDTGFIYKGNKHWTKTLRKVRS